MRETENCVFIWNSNMFQRVALDSRINRKSSMSRQLLWAFENGDANRFRWWSKISGDCACILFGANLQKLKILNFITLEPVPPTIGESNVAYRIIWIIDLWICDCLCVTVVCLKLNAQSLCRSRGILYVLTIEW